MKRSRIGASTLVGVCLLTAGCGGGGTSRVATADGWVAAVNQGHWLQACRLLVGAADGCPERLQKQLGGRTYRLLPAGKLIAGDRVTDNKSFFAMLASDESLLSFDVVRIGPRDKIRERALMLSYRPNRR